MTRLIAKFLVNKFAVTQTKFAVDKGLISLA